MKELIDEIEAFQADIKRDLGLDDALLTNQAIIDFIGNWDYFLKIKNGDVGKENNLRTFRSSMEKVNIKNPEGEVYALAEKLKRAYHQNEIN
ncbi:hypothetical protein J0A71_08g18010 [Encephalitozoon cuniculi]|nr:hypothetical protein J0A71_08g18010 [Encephalitozoon cuniculi]